MWDLLHRFTFDNCEMRGVVVRLDDSVKRSLDAHAYPDSVREFLAHATAAIAMLSSTIKIKGRVSLQLKGEGHLSLLMAECTDDFGLRAIARVHEPLNETSFAELTRGGLLVLSLLPDVGTQYQGVVPLQGMHLSDCLEHYFAQSEQLATRMILAFDGQRVAGLMVQALPSAHAEDIDRITALANTVRAEELLQLPIETLLHRLYHEEALRLYDAQVLRFQCRCSRDKMRNSLRMLERDELQQILQEQGHIAVNCEFCNVHYHFDAIDVADLDNDTPGSTHAH